MAGISLTIDQLILDLKNPRENESESQNDAIQKLIEEQDTKIIILAEDIIDRGMLNPMDRLLVMQSSEYEGKYISLEGNRRIAVLKIFNSPNILNGIVVRIPIKKKFIELSEQFNKNSYEPIDCFEFSTRGEADHWIQLRHTGANEGAGVVEWNSIMQRRRFRENDPALQAIDFVLAHGNLPEEIVGIINNGKFKITNLERLIMSSTVRQELGLEIINDKLSTNLPFEEMIKPLRRVTIEIGNGKTKVDSIKTIDLQKKYLLTLTDDLPDLTKGDGIFKTLEELGLGRIGTVSSETPVPPGIAPTPPSAASTGGSGQQTIRPPKPRTTLVPKRGGKLNVTIPRILEIYKEFRILDINTTPNSISVLLRPFFEMSTDVYLIREELSKLDSRGKWKSFQDKVKEAITHMVKNKGADARSLEGVKLGISTESSPLYYDRLHHYVHNPHFSPTAADLTAAWDNSLPYLEKIWPL